MRLQIHAPARLHFGLMEIDPSRPNCFGGLGLMLPLPSLVLTATTSDAFRIAVFDGEFRRRIEAASVSTAKFLGLSQLPAVELSLDSPVRLHNGLGVGTQLACAVATLIATITVELGSGSCDQLQDGWMTAASVWKKLALLPDAAAAHEALADASGRGKRSHVGIRGFLFGGFLYDSGATLGDRAVVERRIESIAMPKRWRTVLLIGRGGQGPSGAAEQRAFDRSGLRLRSPELRRVPEQLKRLADDTILPSLRDGRFAEFRRSIAEYNELAGRLFDADAVADAPRAEQMRRGRELLAQNGFTSTGQSSWGPTLWAMADSSQSIDRASLQQRLDDAHCDYDVVDILQSSGGAILSTPDPLREIGLCKKMERW